MALTNSFTDGFASVATWEPEGVAGPVFSAVAGLELDCEGPVSGVVAARDSTEFLERAALAAACASEPGEAGLSLK
jgi:hypothetical protein